MIKRPITDILSIFSDNVERYLDTSKNEVAMLSNEDVASINAYNKLLEQGKTSTDAFDLSIKDASQSVKEMAINAEGGTIKLQAMTKAEKSAAIAGKALVSIGKLAIGVIAGMALGGLISWISALVNQYNTEQEHMQDFSDSFVDSMNKIKNEQKSISDLTNQYIKAIASTNDLTSSKEELKSIQDTLINNYEDEANGIDLVNGKISEQIAALLKLKRFR